MADTNAPTQAGATSEVVAKNATKHGELPLDQLALIGITGKPGTMTALFRTENGEVQTVKEGNETRIGQVFEISEAGVVVTRSNGNSVFIPPLRIG
ncbi:pilus assembly protein PilP [Maritimibacter dapengensis]|uniref:Pilus assembly protein PilP n=1 Tax=Maritimibacter dapengensis TaxID=2836868 RepID=A0ABS6T216_9RHOB|nr:pilus assembly protein PilP [Maritimibacter dapengensis]MBV7379235.1 pilus assembly protein PilP [Maritimibacter dapengensis]